ncbi:hypothetical protein [Aquimarina sp. 2201CG5-10]|uniref:hypothetical protein n=1 Tax=Aquimarina callyspongiae TaxID=3098150 RepID=UPI002AB4B36B|nr:hypothetical protein [Aquimarina sp. 2201CG5-10]MDY8135919.1 hypothetical protein [Aquimarina sp. 2201CG5-10]
MKTINLILMTVFTGSVLIVTARINKEMFSDTLNNIPKTSFMNSLELEKQMDDLAAKELVRSINFEDVFNGIQEDFIEPSDILDLKEGEEIQINIQCERY